MGVSANKEIIRVRKGVLGEEEQCVRVCVCVCVCLSVHVSMIVEKKRKRVCE